MEDIAPKLLEDVRAEFERILASDKRAATFLKKIEEGAGDYEMAGNYADLIGEAFAKAMKLHISSDTLPDGKMYWNIANTVMRPLFNQNYDMAVDAAIKAQKAINAAAGIGLNAVTADRNDDKIESILNLACSADHYDDVATSTMQAVQTFAHCAVDDTLKANADFQSNAGINAKIVRTAESKCCKWCSNLAGTYKYDKETTPKDVFRRHDRCRCVVVYVPDKGQIMNVHTKRPVDATPEKIRARKALQGIDTTKPSIIKRYQRGSEIFDADSIGQEYRSKRIGSPETFTTRNGQQFLARRIEGYEGKVFVDDDTIVKPKAIHTINKNTDEAIKDLGMSESVKPNVVITSFDKLRAYGKYDAVSNSVYYIPEIADKGKLTDGMSLGDVEKHEMVHLLQAEKYRNGGGVITSENFAEYRTAACKKSKEFLAKNGVSEYNVKEISVYAAKCYNMGLYDEVEAEFRVLKR